MRLFTRTISIANAADPADVIEAANALGGEGVFEIAQGDSLFVPYGDYNHARGLQKFSRESAEKMRASFHGIGARLKRAITGAPGRPIYRGHPDVPGRPDSDPSAPALGWVQDIVAENDGARFPVKWNEDGRRAVANAHYRFYSPFWDLVRVAGGIMPVNLKSFGLTNNPLIPVPAIANDHNEGTHPMIPQWLKDMLIAAKLIDSTADDTAVETAAKTLGAANDQLVAITAERDELNTQNARLTGELNAANARSDQAVADLSAANDKATKAESDLTAANDALTASRAARIDADLASLLTASKITPIEKDAKRTELLALANDAAIGEALDGLHAAEPKLKTQSVTGSLGLAKGKLHAANDAEMRAAKRREAIDAELVAANDALPPGERYDIAFNRALKKHPELFQTAAAA